MSRHWWTLIGTCAGLFLLMLDSTVVALALPSIRRDIGATATGLQWVLNGYLLAIAVLVVTAGRLGDMFGRKRLFLTGMVLFALGSLLSGAAGSEPILILGRVIQGIGAAPMLPLSLAIVCNAFPGGQQARALGIWAAISALALAVGPLVGGALVELDWRVIFWINLPIAALGVLITALAATESTDPNAGRRIDLRGLAALSAGLTAVVLALVQARVWGGETALLLGLSGVAILFMFWRIEHRVSGPIVEFSLFRNGPYLGASAAAFALVGAYWCVMFFQPQYLQEVRGHSAVLSGLMILPSHRADGLDLAFLGPSDRPLRGAAVDERRNALGGWRSGNPDPDKRGQPLCGLALRLPCVWNRSRPCLRADVDCGDGGDAGREGGCRLGGLGDGPGDGRSGGACLSWRRLSRPPERR